MTRVPVHRQRRGALLRNLRRVVVPTYREYTNTAVMNDLQVLHYPSANMVTRPNRVENISRQEHEIGAIVHGIFDRLLEASEVVPPAFETPRSEI